MNQFLEYNVLIRLHQKSLKNTRMVRYFKRMIYGATFDACGN